MKKLLIVICIAGIITSCNPREIRYFDAVVAIDGSGDYVKVQDAIDAAPEGRTADSPWLIFVRNGMYEELVNVPSEKTSIYLIGEDRDNTVIHYKINVQGNPEREIGTQWYENGIVAWEYSSNNPESHNYRKNGGVVVNVQGDDFYAENITFTNDWGVERQRGPQALAMMTYGDRVSFYNCSFRSFQDTWKTARVDTFRAYAKDCFIEGAVDYIYGSGNYYFETCTLFCVREGSVIVAPNHSEDAECGYVFESCVIDGKGWERTKFGRPWRNSPIAVFLNTTVLVGMEPEGWDNMGGLPRHFSEYNSRDGNGNPLDVSKRKNCYTSRNTGETKCNEPLLTEEEAKRFNYSAVTNGKDNWNPRNIAGFSENYELRIKNKE